MDGHDLLGFIKTIEDDDKVEQVAESSDSDDEVNK